MSYLSYYVIKVVNLIANNEVKTTPNIVELYMLITFLGIHFDIFIAFVLLAMLPADLKPLQCYYYYYLVGLPVTISGISRINI